MKEFIFLLFALILIGCSSYEKRGNESAAKGAWIRATQFYQQALDEDPDNENLRQKLERSKEEGANYYYSKGMQSVALDDYNGAISHFSNSLQLKFKENVKLELEKAKAGRIRKQSQEAINQGIISLNQKKLTAAQLQFLQALNYLPDNDVAKNRLEETKKAQEQMQPILDEANQLIQLKKWEESLSKYEEVLRNWSDNQSAIDGQKKCRSNLDYPIYFRNGEKEMASSNWVEALDAFKQAQNCIKTPEVASMISLCQSRVDSIQLAQNAEENLNQKNLDEAFSQAQKSLQLNPNNPKAPEILNNIQSIKIKAESYLSEAKQAQQKQAFPEAINLYEKVLSLWNNADAQKGIKYCKSQLTGSTQLVQDAEENLNQRNLDEAINKAQKAIDLNPENSQALEILDKARSIKTQAEIPLSQAKEAQKKQDFVTAITLYETVLTLWNNADAQNGIAYCNKILNQPANYKITLHGAIILPFKPVSNMPWDGWGGRISEAENFVKDLGKFYGPQGVLSAELGSFVLKSFASATEPPDCFPIISADNQDFGGINLKDQDDFMPTWNLSLLYNNATKLDNRVINISVYDADLSDNDNVGSYQITVGDLLKKEGVQDIPCFDSSGKLKASGILLLKISVEKVY